MIYSQQMVVLKEQIDIQVHLDMIYNQPMVVLMDQVGILENWDTFYNRLLELVDIQGNRDIIHSPLVVDIQGNRDTNHSPPMVDIQELLDSYYTLMVAVYIQEHLDTVDNANLIVLTLMYRQ
jgi:hypothetical protein